MSISVSVRTRLLGGSSAGALALALLALPPSTPQAYAAALNPCQESDNTRPSVADLALSPSTVDVTGGPAEVTLSARLADAGGPGPATGVTGAHVELMNQSTYQQLRWQLSPVEGDVWAGTLELPPGTAQGTWSVQSLRVVDGAGNERGDSDDEGWDHLRQFDDVTLEVASVPDTTPPVATKLAISRTRLDTRDRPRDLRVRVKAADDLSGVRSVEVGASRKGHEVYTELRRKGDAFVGTLTIPRWVGTGEWRISSVLVADAVGNTESYRGGSELDPLGQRGFWVRSGRDVQVPQMRWARLRPRFVDLRETAQRVRVTARVTDNRSGVRSVEAHVLGKTITLRRVRGTARDGRWVGSRRFGLCHDVGSRPPRFIFLAMTDRAGNEDGRATDWRFRYEARDNHQPRMHLVDSRTTAGGPLVVRFSEPVNGIHPGSATVREMRWPDPPSEPLPGSWTCTGRDGAGTPCSTGAVTTASWVPEAPLMVGANYRIDVNPDGNLDVTDLSGNPVRRHDRYVELRVVE